MAGSHMQKRSYDMDSRTLTLEINQVEYCKNSWFVRFETSMKLSENGGETCFDFLNQAEIEFEIRRCCLGGSGKEEFEGLSFGAAGDGD